MKHALRSGLLLLLATAAVMSQEAAVPASAEETFRLGEESFNSGDFQKAYELFGTACKQTPSNVAASFYLGRAAFEVGDYETAVMAFDRVLIMAPDYSDRTKLELARSYYNMGVHELARTYFVEVLDTNPPESVRRNVEAFLEKMDKAKQRHHVSGKLTLGVDWDSNVAGEPHGTVSIIVPPYEVAMAAVNDVQFSADAMVEHRYKWLDTPFAWKSSALIHDSAHRHEGVTDQGFVSIAAGPSIEAERSLVDVQGVYEWTDYGHQTYLRSRGARLFCGVAIDPERQFSADIQIMDKDYKQDPKRDALLVAVNGGPVFSHGPERLSLSIGFRNENATDDIESYDAYTARVRYDRKFENGFDIYGSYRVWYLDYHERDPLFENTRKDRRHEMTLGVTKKIRPNVLAELSYTFTDSTSSVDLYKYDRHVTALQVSYSF